MRLLSPDEHRRALFNKRPRGFLVILGLAGLDLPPRLEIEQRGKRAVFGSVEVLLHQAERDAWPLRKLAREFHGGRGELGVWNDPVRDAQRQRWRGVDRLGGEIELPRFAGADQFGQEVAPAEVAGEAD